MLSFYGTMTWFAILAIVSLSFQDHTSLHFMDYETKYCVFPCKWISKREDVYLAIKAFALRGEWMNAEAKRFVQILVSTKEKRFTYHSIGLIFCFGRGDLSGKLMASIHYWLHVAKVIA